MVSEEIDSKITRQMIVLPSNTKGLSYFHALQDNERNFENKEFAIIDESVSVSIKSREWDKISPYFYIIPLISENPNFLDPHSSGDISNTLNLIGKSVPIIITSIKYALKVAKSYC